MLVMLKAALTYLALNLALMFGMLQTQPAPVTADQSVAPKVSAQAAPAAKRLRTATSSSAPSFLMPAAYHRSGRHHSSFQEQADLMRLSEDIQKQVHRSLRLDHRSMASAERALVHARLVAAGFRMEPSVPVLPPIPGLPTETTSQP